MTWVTQKGPISWIAVSVVGLAAFLVLGSWSLVSYPTGSTIRVHFYGLDRPEKFNIPGSSSNEAATDSGLKVNSDLVDERSHSNTGGLTDNPSKSNSKVPSSATISPNDEPTAISSNIPPPLTNLEAPANLSLSIFSESKGPKNDTSDPKTEVVPDISSPQNAARTDETNSDCDLYRGSWVHDSSGALYRNDSCPVLSQMQNCQGNGRPDKDYENWRWKPFNCDLPRFDVKKFLELMRGKTIAFIGDSVCRNQMESMMCILWQVEEPRRRGNRNMQKFFFRSTSVTVIRIWSSWLVKQTNEPLDFAPEGVVKLHLDAPDDTMMKFIPSFDVVVLSSGHWFAKRSVYVLNNKIVGGQLWWPDKSRKMEVNNIEAYGISVETILTALVTHPNYTGLTILRSYSPDHYEGGAWNTGGSCTGKERPLEVGKLVENGFTNVMHEKQITGFNRAVKKATNKSKLRLMDITEVFSYRHDGHPGPYRSPDPNKVTKRGPDGRPPPQDCLHWCMPGPVDTWNEFVLEIIRREFEGNQSSSS